ncbi:mucin-6 [Salvelinus sp. IW2-2015]|uniref:mucin-6 n=1 Tax=Salvelinus sp. IW2-2015 TaxID=2691554 RepID=UPI0038D4CA31
MSLGFSEVHRPSTVSSVTEPMCVLTTEWAWFWEDEYGKWVQYASIKEMHRLSSITSEDLEKRFQEDQSAVVKFTAGQQSYELSFRDMMQKNKRYGTVRMVRRHPVFVSTADSRTNRTCNSSQNFRDVPGFWDKSAIPDIGYKTVTLLSSDRDYQKVQRLFNNTMRGFQITSIERVQNRDLWEVFQWKRDLMKKNNGGKNSKELHLFHGTDPKHVDAICRDNFDWRLCGTNGTVYGEGSYFARDAKYSHCFISHSGVRSMFVCRVLVGDYTLGNSDLRRPPPKGEGNPTFYDSCVDNVLNPSIYVVFEKHQVYPEFLIRYDDGVMHLSSSAPAPPKTVSIQSTYIVQYPTSNRIQAAAAATLSNSRVPSTSTLNPSQAATTFSNPTNSLPPSRLPKPAQTSLGFSQSAVIMKPAPSSQLVDTTLGQANWSYIPSFSKLPHKLITQASTPSRTPNTPPSTPSYTLLPQPVPPLIHALPQLVPCLIHALPQPVPPLVTHYPSQYPSHTRITPASTPLPQPVPPLVHPLPQLAPVLSRVTPASTPLVHPLPQPVPPSHTHSPSQYPLSYTHYPSRTPTTPSRTPLPQPVPPLAHSTIHQVSAPSRTLITPGTAHTRTLTRSSNPFRTLTTPASPPSRTLSRSTDTPAQAHTSSTTTTHSLPASSTSHSLSPSYSLSTPYHTPSHSSYTPTSTDSSTLLGSHHSTSTTTSDTSATITSSRVQELIKHFGGQSSTC